MLVAEVVRTRVVEALVAVVAEVLDAEVLVTVVVLVAELVWTKVVEVWAPPPQAQHAHWSEPSPLKSTPPSSVHNPHSA